METVDSCSENSAMETYGNGDVESSTSNDIVNKELASDTVKDKPNDNKETLGFSKSAVKEARRKSFQNTLVVDETGSPKTPNVSNAKSVKAKNSAESASTKTKAVSSSKRNAQVETPDDSTPKGRSKKKNVADPVNKSFDTVEIQTPNGTKSKKGAQKKKTVLTSPVGADDESMESPNVDKIKPLKKNKSLVSVKKSAAHAEVENDEHLSDINTNTSIEDPKVRGRKKSLGGLEEPLFTDDRLPEGWSRILTQRQGGATAGKYDVYILSPDKRRFRSRNELRNFIAKNGLKLQADDFDFSVCGKELKMTETEPPVPTVSAKKAVKKKSVVPLVDTEPPVPTVPAKKAVKRKSVVPLVDTEPPVPTVSAKKAVKRKSVAPQAVQKPTPPAKKKKVKQTRNDNPQEKPEESEEPSSSPYFSGSEFKKAHPALRMRPLIGPTKWTPPRSPYNLIQENLFHNPWQLLVATILLNKSLVLENDLTGKTAHPIIYAFFDKWPTPESVEIADIKGISKMIRPLGLHDKRAHTIKRFSVEYRAQEWLYPKELYGIGKYGNDSYRMFCVNEWRAVNPSDTMLIMYKNWMVSNWRQLCNNTNNCLRLATQ